LRTRAELGLAGSEIVYLGDSPVDVQTAHAAGMCAVGAGWGFRPVEELRRAGADATIAHPRELLPMLDAGALTGPERLDKPLEGR
jgi:phosphoglycolate phosphatase